MVGHRRHEANDDRDEFGKPRETAINAVRSNRVSKMSTKILAAAAFLAALVSGHAAQAAGPGGFARTFAASPALEYKMADVRPAAKAQAADSTFSLTRDKAQELVRVNRTVNKTIDALDSYFDGFQTDLVVAAPSGACFDCADLKRDRLVALGWPDDRMHVTYALTDTGRVQRVLVVSTDRGQIVLGEKVSVVRGWRNDQAEAAAEALSQTASKAPAAYYDI